MQASVLLRMLISLVALPDLQSEAMKLAFRLG